MGDTRGGKAPSLAVPHRALPRSSLTASSPPRLCPAAAGGPFPGPRKAQRGSRDTAGRPPFCVSVLGPGLVRQPRGADGARRRRRARTAPPGGAAEPDGAAGGARQRERARARPLSGERGPAGPVPFPFPLPEIGRVCVWVYLKTLQVPSDTVRSVSKVVMVPTKVSFEALLRARKSVLEAKSLSLPARFCCLSGG